MKKYAKVIINVFLIALFFMLIPHVDAASYNIYTVKHKCPVRVKAGENSDPVKNGNDTVYVYPDQQIEYLNSDTGFNNGKPNQTWYAVKFDYAAREYTGYVAKACMYDTKTYSYNDDNAFEALLNEQKFPESYKAYLRKLHAMHPNWIFKSDHNTLSWKSSVDAESEKGTSAISYLYPSLIFRDSSNPNGIVVDGTSWYAPCWDAVAYYMDPRNFLNEKSIFMFEKLAYDASHSEGVVQAVLDGTFMGGTFNEQGKEKTYASAFISAAVESGVSAIHLAARAKQEMGTTNGSASNGKTPGYEGYYNFYNIGATSGTDNYLKGLEFAKSQGWDSVQKSITGGANFIGDKYIKKGQDSLYFQKFNTSSKRSYAAYTHQYMTNIMAASSESNSIYTSYKEKKMLNNTYVFTIPVYLGMPDSAFKVSRNDTVGGNTDPKPTPTPDPKPVITPAEKVSKAGFSLQTGYLTNLPYGADVSHVKQRLIDNGASSAVLNGNYSGKLTGKIATGDIVNVDDAQYTAVIYGDVSSDGEITIKDLLLVQKYLLGSQKLSGANYKAADVSKDNDVTIKDLLLIQKYLLGNGSISQ